MSLNIQYFQDIINTFIDQVKIRDVNFSAIYPKNGAQIGLAVAVIVGVTGITIQLVKKVFSTTNHGRYYHRGYFCRKWNGILRQSTIYGLQRMTCFIIGQYLDIHFRVTQIQYFFSTKLEKRLKCLGNDIPMNCLSVLCLVQSE